MITANRLRDGEVLYWRTGDWVLALADGEVFADPKAADAALAEAMKYETANKVVNPYLFDVKVADGVVKPAKEREIIRAKGPTVRGEGKQALGAFDVSL
jgi:hypothetical protein